MGYLSQPWTIITGFRDGGMAEPRCGHRPVDRVVALSRKNRLPYVWSLDRIMIPVGIGGAIVRLGNLFNSEIFKRATTLPLGLRVRALAQVGD